MLRNGGWTTLWIGKLDTALDEAQAKRWTVVDMKAGVEVKEPRKPGTSGA